MGVPADQLERLRAALAPRYRVLNEVGRGGMASVYLAEDTQARSAGGREGPAARAGRGARAGALSAGDSDRRRPRPPAHPSAPRLRRSRRCPLLCDAVSSRARRCAIGWSASASSPSRRRSGSRERWRTPSPMPTAWAIVHRDIKPENILFMGGHAVIADFGVAYGGGSAGGTRITQSGLSVGTPVYMSPGAGAGAGRGGRPQRHLLAGLRALRDARRRAAVRGAEPAGGGGEEAERARAGHGRLRDSISPGLESAVRRALAKLPADRFDTADPVRRRRGAGCAGRSACPEAARRAACRPRWLCWQSPASAVRCGTFGRVTTPRRDPAA